MSNNTEQQHQVTAPSRYARSKIENRISCVISEPKWAAWLRAQNAQNVTICDYYLGKCKATKDNLSAAGVEDFILLELFTDAINNGTLTPPDKVILDSLSLRLDPDDYYYRELVVQYTLKPSQAVVTGATSLRHDDLNNKLSNAIQILVCISAAIHSAS